MAFHSVKAEIDPSTAALLLNSMVKVEIGPAIEREPSVKS